MGLGSCWRRRQRKSSGPGKNQVKPLPIRYWVRDIRVSDDGFGLAGRRYDGFHREVARRQAVGSKQDEVSVWINQEGRAYVKGTPRVNSAGELEILDGGKLIGTVRLSDGALYFYPVE